jgi:hypothetical protein
MYLKGDDPARARFDAASFGTEVYHVVVNITGDKPAHQPPKLARQDVGFAVHRADYVAGLHRQAVDFITMDHNFLHVYYTPRRAAGFKH